MGSSADPSGPWYEAALPEREAFCMRDVSHQCLAGEYLGLHEQNLNMMKLFASNISESKDWCTYWEINRYNQPAPVDYRNDKEFWYNLPANFDVLQACYRLYKISGDVTYIKDPVFLNFYKKTVNEYIDSWQLHPEQLYTRDRFLNTPDPINMNDYFHIARGLPSYIESSPALEVGADLIASLYAGLNTYANILELNGEIDSAIVYRQRAKEYITLLEKDWWDESQQTYYSFKHY
ncbi:MAG: hypothetical protein HC831_05670 [Chloroflexia bacterium]|nr:hypothetical protein [Chloroflexia bacterium]